MLVFWICAALMLALGAGLLLRPLLRRGRDTRRAALDAALAAGVIDSAEYEAKCAALPATAPGPAPGVPLWVPFALGLALSVAAIGLYRTVGEPRALDPQTVAAGPNASAPAMEEAVRGLEARLRDNPADLEGWLLLGRAYKSMQRFDDAKATLAKALALAPDNPDAMVEYAESIALAAPDHRIAGQARTLLDRALSVNPANQRGLWMLGIAEVQEGRHAEAVAAWERLLAQLPPGSDVAASVTEQIEQARQAGGLVASAPAAAPAATTAASPSAAAPPVAATASSDDSPAASTAALTVAVDVADELKSRIAPGDVLFVFARAPEGPKMPLAIQRLPATGFPLRLVLDDSMGMMPALKLSQAERVVVGARISKSGNAAPQSGDFEIISAPIALKDQALPVELLISNIVP